MLKTVLLLVVANGFMTFAWYGHLRDIKTTPLWTAIITSWFIAFFEYCFQVPANRLGSQHFSLPQLKVLQEVITMIIFAGFSTSYMHIGITRNYFLAAMLLAGAAYLIFSER